MFEDKHLLEVFGNYLIADYESEHGATMEVSNILIAYNKNSTQNEVIDCKYIPFIFLKAIEDKLGKLRENLCEKNSKVNIKKTLFYQGLNPGNATLFLMG